MTDEEPIDLRALEPDDPPDQAARAVRRFRWWVVLTTTTVIVVVAAAAVAVAGAYFEERRDARMLEEWAAGPQSQTAIQGGSNCRTPTYEIGSWDVTILEASGLGESLVYHLIIDGNGQPLAVQEQAGEDSFRQTVGLTPIGGAQAEVVEIIAKPGWSMGEAYVRVSSGDEPAQLQLVDSNGKGIGRLTLDQDALDMGKGC